jgi:hypothetical protein
VAVGIDRQIAEQAVALLLGGPAATAARLGSGVGLVDDHQLRAGLDELGAAAVALDEVDRDDGNRVLHEQRAVHRQVPSEGANGAGTDDDGREVELLDQLGTPLFAEVGRAEDAEAADLAAIEQLAGDHRGLDRLADADIVAD